eukprot:7384586-Prymnesium_polylepis.1
MMAQAESTELAPYLFGDDEHRWAMRWRHIVDVHSLFEHVLRVRARYDDGRLPEPIVGFTTVYKRHLLTVLRTFHSKSIPLFIDLDKMIQNKVLVQRGARPDEWLALRCRPPDVATAPSLQLDISLFNGTNNEDEALSEALRRSMPSPVKPSLDSVAPCALRVPDALCCPITMELFKDPVKTELNFTYERSAIEEWFALGNKSDPLTGALLPSLILTDDRVMLARCRYFGGQGRGGRG